MRTAPFLLLMTTACGPAEGPGEAQPTSGSIAVLTYNVAGLPTGIASVERPTNERMERIAPFVDDYDLLGLQEDFTDEGHELLLAEATHPVAHWFDGLVGNDRAYGSGLSLLSRAGEASDYAEEHYSDCNGTLDSGSDCLASKGLQRLRLMLGGRALDVYNTHHEAGGGPEDEAARAVQVGQVIAAIERESADAAVLFMGDTNLRPSDPPDAVELQRYAEAGLADACELAACPEPDRIDRFLLRDGNGLQLTVRSWSVESHLVDEEGADLSDHHGIAIELDWRTVVR